MLSEKKNTLIENFPEADDLPVSYSGGPGVYFMQSFNVIMDP